jgi:hypothetical protein
MTPSRDKKKSSSPLRPKVSGASGFLRQRQSTRRSKSLTSRSFDKSHKLSPLRKLRHEREISVWGWWLIIVWLEVRVLPTPPRSPIQTEISRCHANSAEPPGFRAGALSLLSIGLSVIGLFDAAISAPQNPVSRKRRPTMAEHLCGRVDLLQLDLLHHDAGAVIVQRLLHQFLHRGLDGLPCAGEDRLDVRASDHLAHLHRAVIGRARSHPSHM